MKSISCYHKTFSHIRIPSLFVAMFAIVFLGLTTGCDSMNSMDEGGEGGKDSDTTSPTVSIISPVANAKVGGEVTIDATAADAGGIFKVEFYIDGNLAGSSLQAPYSYEWNTLDAGDGSHTLQAKAYDQAGNQSVSSVVTVSAENKLDVSFRNNTFTSVTINPSGHAARVVAAGKTTTFTYTSNPGTVTYNASTKGKHGKTVSWSNKRITTKGRISESVSLNVGNRIFFLRMKNSSSRSTSSLYVNYDRSDETHIKPYSLGSSMTGVGYFQGHSQTEIRMYAKYKFGDLGPVYWKWTENIPTSSNYRISLTLTGSSAAAKADSQDGPAFIVDAEPYTPDTSFESGVVHTGELVD